MRTLLRRVIDDHDLILVKEEKIDRVRDAFLTVMRKKHVSKLENQGSHWPIQKERKECDKGAPIEVPEKLGRPFQKREQEEQPGASRGVIIRLSRAGWTDRGRSEARPLSVPTLRIYQMLAKRPGSRSELRSVGRRRRPGEAVSCRSEWP